MGQEKATRYHAPIEYKQSRSPYDYKHSGSWVRALQEYKVPTLSRELCGNDQSEHPKQLQELQQRHNQDQDVQQGKCLSRKHSKNLPPPQCITGNSGELIYIGKHIASGGYSRCYLAHAGAGQVYAAKTITKSSSLSALAIEQIEREIRIHQRLHHPSILRFLQCIEKETHIFLILDYCANNTLHDLISHRGRLREIDAGSLLYQLVLGVQYLHVNLVHHGDIKMSNILLDEKLRPKIADFGFSLHFRCPADFRTSLCGTPAYMAPEILRKRCQFGLPADIWSLGVVGYAMIYGVTAFDAPTVRGVYKRIAKFDLVFPEVVPSITQDAVYTVYSMLTFKPECRPTANTLAKRSWLMECFKMIATCSVRKEIICDDKKTTFNLPTMNKAQRLRNLFTNMPKPRCFPGKEIKEILKN